MTRFLALVLCFAAALVPLAAEAQAPSPLADAAAEQRKALEAAQTNLKETEERRRRLAAEVEALKGERGKLQASLIATVDSIRDKEPAIEERGKRLSELVESERQVKASLAARRGVLAEVIAALQRMGRRPPPALLVRPNDALEAVRSAILLGAVVPDMRAEAEALGSDLRELVRLTGLMRGERDTLAREISELQLDRERLAALIDERQRQQGETERTLSGEAARQVEIARSVADLEALIAKAEAEQAARAAEASRTALPDGKTGLASLQDPTRLAPALPFDKARGLLPFPVSGKRLHVFGDAGGREDVSKGVSIAAPSGAVVTAPCDGWVVYAGPFRSYGQLLILNAGDGYHVLLAGMERISVALNQFVLTGEPVATMRGVSPGRAVPATGSSERPVLYVEFRKDRTSIDPSPWWAGTPGEKAGG